jgi:hypothetical protein
VLLAGVAAERTETKAQPKPNRQPKPPPQISPPYASFITTEAVLTTISVSMNRFQFSILQGKRQEGQPDGGLASRQTENFLSERVAKYLRREGICERGRL